jgi:hypothetical protein
MAKAWEVGSDVALIALEVSLMLADHLCLNTKMRVAVTVAGILPIARPRSPRHARHSRRLPRVEPAAVQLSYVADALARILDDRDAKGIVSKVVRVGGRRPCAGRMESGPARPVLSATVWVFKPCAELPTYCDRVTRWPPFEVAYPTS